MKLLLFGNPALPFDNLALQVGKKLELEGHTVRHLENLLELLDLDLSQHVILDVAVGIDDVKLIENVDKLVLGRLCSLHDMDMAYFLKLLKELGRLDSVRIVALPQAMAFDEALAKARAILPNL